MFAQKHLAAASLPAEMVGVIDISDKIGLLKADDVAVFVESHGFSRVHATIWEFAAVEFLSLRDLSAKAITSGAEFPRTMTAQVQMVSAPERNRVQPSSVLDSKTSGALTGCPIFFKHSNAVHNRVAAASRLSARSRAIRSASFSFSSPSKSRHTSSVRAATSSMSHATPLAPATASVKSLACAAEMPSSPKKTGLRSGRRQMRAALPSACWITAS